ncbi:MAG: HD family phosphohydrolase [Clostridia bacterium]|nr:HD family phosphohydrolase [Clostridia bacterium]
MNDAENAHFQDLVKEVSESPECQVLKTYRQHGSISTYEHCMSVARESFHLAHRLHLKTDERALVRGAFLHDYYLYDWHHSPERLHGFRHPIIAMHNALRDFRISAHEAHIIRTHMWPLTLRSIPTTREAFLVCLADKICALKETLFHR